MDRPYWVYILASRRNGTLYVGVTNDLSRRVYEHKHKLIVGFTARYGVDMLVWYETHGDISDAIAREKSLKRWRRAWKLALIEEMNPLGRSVFSAEWMMRGLAPGSPSASGVTCVAGH